MAADQGTLWLLEAGLIIAFECFSPKENRETLRYPFKLTCKELRDTMWGDDRQNLPLQGT